MIHAESWSRVLARDVVQPGLVGKVHSVFDRACNLMCAGHLIGLVDPALGNGPYTIVVATPTGGYTSSPDWQPGRTVSFQLGFLLLEGHPVVDFASAVEWEPDPARPAQIGDHAANYDAKKISKFETCTFAEKLCWVTSAALSPNRKRLALLDSQRIWLFENWHGDDFFSGDKYRIDLGLVTQKEAITFLDENTLVFTDEEFHGIGRNAYMINLEEVEKHKL